MSKRPVQAGFLPGRSPTPAGPQSLDKPNASKYPPEAMGSTPERPAREARRPQLWPYVAAATAMIAVAGGLRVDSDSWSGLPRLADAVLLGLYAHALWRRSRCLLPHEPPARPCDLGIVVAAALALALLVWAGLLLAGATDPPAGQALGLIAKGFVVLSGIRRATRVGPAGRHELQLHTLRPVHATLGSFALAIAVGWALLNLPQATPTGHPPLSPLESLFTATSATCVTGLIVKDTPNDFSLFGQLVILALIQVGGLGIMTFAALFDVLRRRGLSVRRRLIVGDLVSAGEGSDARHLVAGIVLFTVSTEAIGALLLWLRWGGTTGSAGRDVLLSIFHSISAFCNAGFSLFSTSLESYVGDAPVNLVIGALIVVGGIGFPVVQALRRQWSLRRRGVRRPLPLHTRLALVTTGYLLLIGFVGFLLLEHSGTLRDLTPAERVAAAAFQSITPRTAGFNTVAISRLAPASLLFIALLMFVGASPGSTGGGIKTTTAALLYLISRAMVAGRDRVPVFGRDVPPEVRHRAVAVGALFGAGIIAGMMLLCITDGLTLADALFEVVSAFGTVGLSTGVTGGLTRAGRLIIIAAMYIGRVGPLSIAMAVRPERGPSAGRFPEEHVMVG